MVRRTFVPDDKLEEKFINDKKKEVNSVFVYSYCLFIYLFVCVACFRSLPLGAEDFENLQELDVQDFEQQLVGEQGK